MPSSTPIYGFPYPLGTDPLGQGAQDIENLATAVETVLSTPRIAWYAYKSSSVTMTDNQRITFTTAVVNVGSHYSTATSLFTCPVDGNYFVQARILTANNTSAAELRLGKNNVKQSAYSGFALNSGVLSSHKQGHVSGVMSCVAGDVLSVITHGNIDVYGSVSDGHTAFMGFLL